MHHGMSLLGQSRRFERTRGASALPPTPDILRHRSERSKRANALNRCAIARCAGSPNASAATGGEIVDSVRVALS
jgi:hypothetical protein